MYESISDWVSPNLDGLSLEKSINKNLQCHEPFHVRLGVNRYKYSLTSITTSQASIILSNHSAALLPKSFESTNRVIISKMVAISTLISGTAILLSSGVFANPIESRAPRDQIFVLNFFKLCNRIDFVANRPHFLEDSTTELTGSRGCFNVPEGYGALVIEDQPTHPACSSKPY